MRQKWYICSLAPSPNLHMRTGISLANFHFFTATFNTFCLKSPLLVVNVFLNLKQSIHPPPIQFSSFLTLIYICESFFGRKERTRKKFDPEKAALPMNFSSPGCTMVTLWSDKLLYMHTLYRRVYVLFNKVQRLAERWHSSRRAQAFISNLPNLWPKSGDLGKRIEEAQGGDFFYFFSSCSGSRAF